MKISWNSAKIILILNYINVFYVLFFYLLYDFLILIIIWVISIIFLKICIFKIFNIDTQITSFTLFGYKINNYNKNLIFIITFLVIFFFILINYFLINKNDFKLYFYLPLTNYFIIKIIYFILLFFLFIVLLPHYILTIIIKEGKYNIENNLIGDFLLILTIVFPYIFTIYQMLKEMIYIDWYFLIVLYYLILYNYETFGNKICTYIIILFHFIFLVILLYLFYKSNNNKIEIIIDKNNIFNKLFFN